MNTAIFILVVNIYVTPLFDMRI